MTEPSRLAASLRFLASVSETLASSFDYPASMRAVMELIVPAYADGVAIELHEREGETQQLAYGKVSGFEAPPAGKKASRGGDIRVDIPLQLGGERLGTIRLARDAGRAFDEVDRAIAADLAVRVATAFAGALAYAREHHVADTLQRALLPERLPSGGGQRFDGAYMPGTEDAIVGGDWYDAFTLPDGRIALSIGDVAGHGLHAAIVMGEVRQAFRAAALNPKSPSLVLERANTIVNMRPNPVMVTAIFGILDPATSALTYAAAGHPAPMLALADGAVHRLPSGGVPLGIADAIDAQDWTFTVPPGSLMAFYTDGLIEHSRDLIEGEQRLSDAVAAEVTSGGKHPARSVLRRVFRDGLTNNDDVAALVVSADDRDEHDFRFDFSAIPLAVPVVRRSLRRYLSRLGISEDQIFAVLTAAGEAVANAVEHAYAERPGVVRLRVSPTAESLLVTIEDDGRWKRAQKRDERGRGVPLMRSLMSGVEIRTDHSHTCVRLSLALG